MSLWRYFMAIVILGCFSANAATESGEPADPVHPRHYTAPGPDNARLTFYRTQGELNQLISIGKHDFCALAGMTQSNRGAPCACYVNFHKAEDRLHKEDGWVLSLTTQSLVLGHDMNIHERQRCACEAVCWDRAKVAE